MNNENERNSDELIICYKFPPSQRVSGVVYAKRLIESQKVMDTIQCSLEDEKADEDFNEIIESFTNKRYFTKTNMPSPTWSSIEKFNEEGMEILEKENIYKKIYSRMGAQESHFLALEYKLKHPESFWTAEFSDPLSVTIDNRKRGTLKQDIFIKDECYIKRINDEISNYFRNYKAYFKKDCEAKNLKLKLIDGKMTIHQLGEYLPFLFADEIVFTNENQMDIMLDFYPEVKELVKSKSRVSHHPILDEKYYHMVESDYKIDNAFINFGYFGTYLGKRHLESIFYAFESLNETVNGKYKVHIFSQNKASLKRIINELDIKENFIINDKLPLLEFLNIITKFDVLIVNDLNTKGNFEKNPFLPSKLADYLGSGKDIWGICEKGSVMSKFDIRYKSELSDYESSLKTLKKIFQDNLEDTEKANLDSIEGDLKEYMTERISQLNGTIESLESQKDKLNKRLQKEREEVSKLKREKRKLNKENDISKLKNENKKLKEEMKKVKSTKGWARYKVKNLKSRMGKN